MTGPISKALMIYRISNRTTEATWKYDSDECLRIPLDFYYNKDSGNIIYNTRMVYHYKQHPPHEAYVLVPNFVEALYKLYQRLSKEESATGDDATLRSAVTSFLTRIYPFERSYKREVSAMQYAFVLPSQEYTNKGFVDTMLRPLLQNTPWVTPDDLASKILFYSKIDTYAYLLNNTTQYSVLRLEREKKYLVCTLQKKSDQDQLLFTARFMRAVFDPDLIAASGRSTAALEGKPMLSFKSISPSLSTLIPINNAALAKMNSLAVFLYSKVFADEEENPSSTQLDDYNTGSNATSLLHRLIRAMAMSSFQNASREKIDVDDFDDDDDDDSRLSDALSENNKSRLSLITYGDIIQIFNDLDMSFVENEIGYYLEEYGDDDELFHSIVIAERDEEEDVEEDDKNKFDKMEINPYNVHNLVFASKYCRLFYLSRAKKAIVWLLKKQRKSKSTKEASMMPADLIDGCAYKILKMVQLSNRLGKPIVIEPVGEIDQESISKAPVEIQQESMALIKLIQPYGHYIEANITCSNQIKMSLNQVIETTSKDGQLEKSTMSILDLSYQTSDMYNFIFDTLWNDIDKNPQWKPSQKYESVDFDSYRLIREGLIDAIKSSMKNKLNVIKDLDEVIYRITTAPYCACDIPITHRLLMDTGLLSYLKCVAGEMVASLKSNAIFGNYKISCLLVTGEFLYKWLKQANSTYGAFIWKHLQQEISFALSDKQPHTHLLMMKSIILEGNNLNYKPFKLEKYQQVFSKHYFLVIDSYDDADFRVYRDVGSYWSEIPVTKEDDTHWRIPIVPKHENDSHQLVCKEKFYIIVNPEADLVYGDIGM
ncbi:hypothetical protein MBANPS3_005331 [Mucor bainieri]